MSLSDAYAFTHTELTFANFMDRCFRLNNKSKILLLFFIGQNFVKLAFICLVRIQLFNI